MIAIKKMKVNNYSSNDFPTFDLILDCSIGDSDNGTISSYLTREGVASETYDGRRKNISNLKYTEVFSPKVTILKKDFKDFTMDEQRQVLKWLTGSDKVTFFDLYDDIYSEAPIYCILGFVSTIETYKIANQRTIGYVVTIESISPFAYSPINTFKRTITAPTTFKVTCNTDDTAYVYPRVTVKQKSGTDVIIKNTIITPEVDLLTGVTVNKTRVFTTAVRKNQVDETVVIDGANKLIYSVTNPSRTFGKDFGTDDILDQWVWLPLTDGENTLTVTGNCDLTLEWREVRKIGEW